MELKEVREGIIVRCIQRLDELLRDVREAAVVLGNNELLEKVEQASTCIKRDIVFAASLYVQDENLINDEDLEDLEGFTLDSFS
jgi:helicase, putative (fragment)